MYLAFRVARTMAGESIAGRKGMAALSSFGARAALPARFNRTEAGDRLHCQTRLACGMTDVKGGGTTDACLTAWQSIGPRERQAAGFITGVAASVLLVDALTFLRSAHELIHPPADRRKAR